MAKATPLQNQDLIRGSLEDYLQSSLNLPGPGGAVVLAYLRLRDPEGGRRDGQRRLRRRGEVGVVEDVVALGAEDQLDLLAQGLGLLEDYVGVDEAGAVKLVAMDGEILAEGLVGKGGGGGAGDLACGDDGSAAGGVGCSDELRAVGGIGVEAVARAAKIDEVPE